MAPLKRCDQAALSSGFCGPRKVQQPEALSEPLLDQVQALSGDHPDINFLHVEIYENLDAATFDDLITVPAVVEWGLPSEPWVFFIDATGMVTARLEGSASEAEINAAISSMHG